VHGLETLILATHGFQTEKLVLLISVWGVACASALTRSCAVVALSRRRGGRFSNRLGWRDHLAIALSSGFATVCILGLLFMVLSADFVAANREHFLGAAAGIGMLGEEQRGLMRNLLYAFLKVKPPEDDNDK